MTTKIDIISSDIQTNFTSTPFIPTEEFGEDSTKLASIEYVSDTGLATQSFLDTYLYNASDQTITGTYSLTKQPTITTIDTPSEGTLNLGDTTDTLITIDYTGLTIKGFIQSLAGYLSVSNTNRTPTGTGAGSTTVVDAQKIQTGSVPIDTLTTIPVSFSPSFSSKPVVLVSVQRNSATVFSAPREWVESVNTEGFTLRSSSIVSNGVINWMAIGT